MGGKSSQSSAQVSIPPEVLAQYQAVNAAATKTAATPFQQYSGQFVAPVNSTQQQGITATGVAANEAQPYYTNATNTLGSAQASTQPYNAAAESNIQNAQYGTTGYNNAAIGSLANAQMGTTGVNNAATALAGASAEQVNASPLTSQAINQYLSPYLSDVVGSEANLLNQNNQEQQAGQLGTAIQSGAFGGDRTGIAAANLEQQQNLANANIYSGLLNQGYNTALSTAQQQQGVNLAAGQANRAALGAAGSELASIGQTAYGEGANTASEAASLGQTAYNEAANTATTQAGLGQTAYTEGANTASELGTLGTGAQTAALQGANAEIGAGTVEQQTQQAQDTALYNQFLQQQSYPFQVDQFLANIAEGTGSLSGSTTTTTQPGGFFSDRRLKSDIKKVGKTFDGHDIVTYKMGTDPRTRMGLIAQDVEKDNPHAVGVAGGFKTLDYGEATKKAAKKGHFARGGFAGGGYVDPSDLSSILQAQQNMYAKIGGANGTGGPRGGYAAVPAASGSSPHLVTAQGGMQAQQPSAAQNLNTTAGLIKNGQGLYNDYKKDFGGGANDDEIIANQRATDAANNQAAQATMYANNNMSIPSTWDQDMESAAVNATTPTMARGGFARAGYDMGGMPYSMQADPAALDIPDDTQQHQLAVAGGKQGGSGSQSGLQQLASLGGSLDTIGNTIGDVFGLFNRGGRAGFAAGGSPDDADPTQDPDVAQSSGVQAASSDITGGAKGTPWYKDTGKLLPLAQALAAFGTAPTKHLGVALAAGLGAGAQAYQQQQNSLTDQNLTQQRTQGVNLANQLAAQKLKYLTSPSPYSQPNIQDQPPTGGNSLQDQLRVQNYVPQVTAQENAAQQDAYKKSIALGSDAPIKAVNTQIENRKTQSQYQNQQKMQSSYDDAVYTYNHTSDPNLKASAAAAADAYHQYTGDKPENLNGVIVNGRTTQPFIGAEGQRLSPDTYTRLAAEGKELVTIPAGEAGDPGKTFQIPKYQAMGFSNVGQYVASLPPQGTPDVPGRTQTPAAPTTRAPMQQRAPTPIAAPKPLAASQSAPNQTHAAPSDFLDKTIHDKAFADPTYRAPQSGSQLGTSFGIATEGKAKAEAEARAALKADSESTVQSASAALQYATAAQQIMNSKGAPVTGLFGPAAKAVSSAFNGVNATNYQEVAKYLGNLAVQSGKGNFPHATEKENMVQFEQLSPSTANTPEALRGLLNSIVKQNQYMRDTANRSTEYLNDAPNGYNGRAQDFFKWNQNYYPRELVNVPKKHLDYLVQHPESAADFKKKYGVLPGGG